MVKTKPKSNTRTVRTIGNTQLILKVFCYTPIAKPLNGSLPRSKASHMLKLDTIPYIYHGKNGNEKNKSSTVLYMLKGIKGVLRRKIALLCYDKGLEVCHSTDKETDKHGTKLLPEGFHQLGSCVSNGECILHQIFGSKGNEGIISVYADPICSITHKTAEVPEGVQKVHIASENRINLSYTGESLQDFNERYFSGYFTFEVDLTKCSPEQIGAIIEGAMNFDRLGRGYNSGSGHITVKKLQLLNRTISKIHVIANEGSFIIQKDIIEQPLERLFQQSLEAWQHGTTT